MTAPQESEHYIGWRAEPGARGTWSILSSCVVTLILCVYTAIHRNIPAASEGRWVQWRDLAIWILTGIFAPEVVVWVAWCQFSDALFLTKEIKKMPKFYTEAGPDKVEAINRLVNSWTRQHSFFVVMGGYQLRPEAAKDHFLLKGRKMPKSVFNAHAFLSLLKGGHVDKFPLLTAQDIADRSKADNVAKILSCLQGSWLAIQLLGRLRGHVAISELEVNTLAHVICALAMYALWMQKPLNIQQPEWVDTQGLEAWIHLHIDEECSPMEVDLSDSQEIQHEKSLLINLAMRLSTSKWEHLREGYRIYQDRTWTTSFVLSAEDYRAAWDKTRKKWQMRSRSHMTTPTAFGNKQRMSSMVVISSLYGGIHACLWNYHFPTMLEAWLWRISSLVVAGNGLVVAAALTFLWAFKELINQDAQHRVCGMDVYELWGQASRYVVMHTFLSDHDSVILITVALSLIWTFVVGAVQLVFGACRVFLFVEAFISLRSQPASVYEVPRWSQWLPHL